jgi:hypothetical protein
MNDSRVNNWDGCGGLGEHRDERRSSAASWLRLQTFLTLVGPPWRSKWVRTGRACSRRSAMP